MTCIFRCSIQLGPCVQRNIGLKGLMECEEASQKKPEIRPQKNNENQNQLVIIRLREKKRGDFYD